MTIINIFAIQPSFDFHVTRTLYIIIINLNKYQNTIQLSQYRKIKSYKSITKLFTISLCYRY